MEINKVGIESIPIIQSLANITWAVTYKEIISNEQKEFMLDKMYSTESLQSQIQQQNHQFVIAVVDTNSAGFASYSITQSTTESIGKLHKIYVDPNQQGKGIGKSILQFILKDISSKGATYLELNVNRQNMAIGFYQKLGFAIIAEEDIPIGNGFFMNDYVMQIGC
jgi:ribosomal protein S18 acetylase RimI-like enzyme